jgi:hypothetical protein
MKKHMLSALAFLILIIFIGVWIACTHISLKTHNSPKPTLTYGYVGYAFVEANTTLEFHGMLIEKELGPGFSISVSGIPEGITQKTGIDMRPCPTPYKPSGFECRDIILFITPTVPGKYDLSNVTITVSSKSGSLSTKLGEVKLEVKSGDESDLKPVYYPYAGTYIVPNTTQNHTFYYYTVFRNYGDETLLLTGVEADESFIKVLGLYYQDVPLNVSPTGLDVPNMNKAQAVPQDGLPIKPEKIVAIIVPVKVEAPAQNAVFALKFEVKNERTGKLEEVPGIPYYILALR